VIFARLCLAKSLIPLNALARAVVDRFLNLRVIRFWHFSVVDVRAGIVCLSKIVAVEAKVARVRVCAQAAARAIIFHNVNYFAHADKMRK